MKSNCATKLFVLIRVHSWFQTDRFKSLDDCEVVLYFLKKEPRMDTNIFYGIVVFRSVWYVILTIR